MRGSSPAMHLQSRSRAEPSNGLPTLWRVSTGQPSSFNGSFLRCTKECEVMKLTRWQLALALGISIWSNSAEAQQTSAKAASYPVRTANLGAADFGLATVSDSEPAEAPAEAAKPAAAPSGCTTGNCTTPSCTHVPANCTASNGNASNCTTAGCSSAPCDCAMECPEACEPWSLFSPLQ